ILRLLTMRTMAEEELQAVIGGIPKREAHSRTSWEIWASGRKALDRKDVSKNYEPENCRWSTKKHQSLNRRFPRAKLTDIQVRRCRKLHANGTTYRRLAARFKVSYHVARYAVVGRKSVARS